MLTTRTSLTKIARAKDYNPPHEVHRFATQRKIRQVRRLESFGRQVSKLNFTDHAKLVAAQQEWRAILNDRAFEGGFAKWCQSQPELGPPMIPLPSFDFVHAAFQLAKHEVNHQVVCDHAIWMKKQSFARDLDRKFKGNSKAFAHVKDVMPPLTELSTQVSSEALLVPLEGQAVEAFCGEAPAFDMAFPVSVNDRPCRVLDIQTHSLILKPLEDFPITDQPMTITQDQVLCTPGQIFQELTHFWEPFWHLHQDVATSAQLERFLSLIPSDFPAPHVVLDNLQMWHDAIRDLKPHSGRGIDAISSAELKSLPEQAIADLAIVMNRYHTSFPEWFMLARTVPLQKVPGRPRAHQTRPITVLSQLFRVWGRVLAKQLLQHFARVMPTSITGMLASRGPLDAAYHQQFWLEASRWFGLPTSGFCLDLVKCFNTINRQAIAKLLLRLGLPNAIVTLWINSISLLKRFWVLDHQCSHIIGSNTGIPEGDSISVICMIAIGYGWTQAVAQHAPRAKLGAYADNWGWSTLNHREHQHIVATTVQYTRCFDMIIDWAKSWIWGKCPQHVAALKRALKPFVSDTLIQKLTHAKDLGCPMSYTGPVRLGHMGKKFDMAKKKFLLLQRLHRSITVKGQVAMGGIYSATFFGAELVPIGTSHLDSFRNNAVNSVLGSSRSRNSTIAMLCVSELVDPEIYLLNQLVRSARRFLHRCLQSERDDFLTMLCQHSGSSAACHGPVGTLKRALLRRGWIIHPQGMVTVCPAVQLSLLNTSNQTWLRWIEFAWQEDVLSHSNRKGHRGLPSISRTDTLQVLQKFNDSERLSLINELSGAFQTASQQSSWDPAVDDKCKHCGDSDTRFHRLFECVATSEARQPFLHLLETLREQGSQCHELPVVFVHQQAEFLAMMHHNAVEACIPEHTLANKLTSLQMDGQHLSFYTDGSCQHPSFPTSRFAAMAIVIDKCQCDEERRYQARLFKAHGVFPSSLRMLACARVVGEQRIHRAELSAIVQICEKFSSTCIFTDSAVSICAFSECVNASSPSELWHKEDFDLITRLWWAQQRGNHSLRKVDAHRSLEAEDDLECFHRLGNHLANDAAISAGLHLGGEFARELAQHHRDIQGHRDQLHLLFQLHLELRRTRAQLDTILSRETQAVRCNEQHTDYAGFMKIWIISQVWARLPIRVNCIQFSAWGSTIARAMLQWMDKVKWPIDLESTPAHSDIGVTWIELVLSFSYEIGMYFPIKRQGPDGKERLVVMPDFASAMGFQARLSELAHWFSIFYKQIEQLTDGNLWPSYDRGLVSSAYHLGSHCYSYGFVVRPMFPWQSEVVTVLESHLKTFPGTALTGLPALTLSPVVRPEVVVRELERGWLTMSQRVHEETKKVRRWRSDPAQQQLAF